MKEARELFETVAIYMLDNGRTAAVERLAEAQETLAPRDPDIGYYLARVRMMQDRYDEAVRLLRAAVPAAPSSERELFVELLMDASVLAGKPLEAYSAAEDPAYGFRYVAESLLWQEDDPAIMELIITHRDNHPQDPWIHFYTGEAYLLQGNPSRAAAALADGLAQAPDEATRVAYEEALTRAWYDDGQMDKAYEELPPRRLRARQIAELCVARSDRVGLERILVIHGRQDPEDPALAIWQAEQYWMTGRYDSVVETLGDMPGALADDYVIGRREDRLVRSLVRLKRFRDAMSVARASTARDGNPFLEVIVHAAAGHVDAATRAMRRSIELGVDEEVFYRDEDAGPALTAEPVAAAEE